MHPLHDYLAKQLADKLTKRRVVIWYDPRREFAPFIAEVRGGPRPRGEAVKVRPMSEDFAEAARLTRSSARRCADRLNESRACRRARVYV
jgi:hypothetical protein